MLNYQRLNVEVLFEDPILVIFRDFASQKEVTEFLADAKKQKLLLQKVVDMTNETSTKRVIRNDRVANGTFISHEGTTAIAKIFKKAKAMIPFVNFEYSEEWQILSYLPGGHYGPHYDYLDYDSEAQWDSWMETHGNRFATFLLVLQNANKGGGQLLKDKNSYHGACVVHKGEKVAAVMWIREELQDLLLYPHITGGLDVGRLINPRLELLQGLPICK
ncbi:unnamed protein product [Heligmosomoides polygyrus]|uniref:P4Hc domain-containing protein n=1 Tax=Heligmosomoides polygyrus TaxID=6339 RepID=A0A3P7YXN6_HELPZ|nr:unnamed protein product [Heligmosomoides polygyrus]